MSEEIEIVLRMLKDGRVSVEQADALLNALREEGPGRTQAGPHVASTRVQSPPASGESPRSEWRALIDELRTVVPREIIREVTRARPVWGSGLSDMVRGLWGLAEGFADSELDESMRSGETLTVHSARGDVRLHRSTDDRLHVKARKRVWAPTGEEARQLAQALEIELRRTVGKAGPHQAGSPQVGGGTVSLAVPRIPERPVRVDLEIAVPAQVSVELSLARGDLEAAGLDGALTTNIAHGDIVVHAHGGPLAVGVARGNVRIREVAGETNVDVKHGDVTVEKIRGTLAIQTTHGDIDVDGCADLAAVAIHGDVSVANATDAVVIEGKHGGIDLRNIRSHDVRVRTKHGDVSLDVTDLGAEGTLNLGTVRGDIALVVPSGARATIDAAARSGRVTCSAPLQNRLDERGSLRGELNGPGCYVHLRVTSGDIDIRTAPRA